MPLTDTAIRAAKPREKSYRVADEQGLALQVNPDGSRGWRFRYRFQGREQLLSFGVYPGVSLRRAREKRKAARDLLDKGINPSAHKKAERVGHALTFRKIATEWLALQKVAVEPDTHSRLEAWLETVCKSIGNRPVAEIEPPEVLALIQAIQGRGHHETARRVRAVIERVLAHAVGTGRAKQNAAAQIKANLGNGPKKKPYPHITEPARLGVVLNLIDKYPGQSVTRHALRLLPLVFTRPGELRFARWSEFTFELEDQKFGDKSLRDDPTWRIPASRMKMGTEHLVALSKQAVQILRDLHSETGEGDLLFPSLRSNHRPISENTLNAALRTLGIPSTELVSHGFRHTASTLLNEQGWNGDLIELQLSHLDRNKIRATYNKALRLAERREMMQGWADYLDGLKAGGKVVPLRARRA
jgi:integrase